MYSFERIDSFLFYSIEQFYYLYSLQVNKKRVNSYRFFSYKSQCVKTIFLRHEKGKVIHH